MNDDTRDGDSGEGLAAEVERLREELAVLRLLVEEMRTEVRTRRVVVVDEHGTERVLMETLRDGTASVELLAADDRLGRTSVGLVAGPGSVGCYLYAGDVAVGHLEAVPEDAGYVDGEAGPEVPWLASLELGRDTVPATEPLTIDYQGMHTRRDRVLADRRARADQFRG